ncbi:hypothetical protein C351_01250 [Cryptococcus neoformans c8]|nr:hypothetical protein C353_01417 [Cryptococcus neoformans var. grubii AD1-83a]OXG66076.1 hypothetical protein C354_01428 [Cryptococcus neoformans var. grubii MW-RSA1955]OXG67730.1 hypothetical protein C351_01250 [Cryptococcus neoformans var. grubii c8]OXG70813.1 hypothetical protein C352_01434 [Cryptococcus neoformans var. grubii CHC193]OXH16128.1 hypothetical protein C369_01403 [Cryptococcus neoformans var. grubii A5-35-17]OXH17775.1 hypothetical protein C370_01410 [Cryptococcus neoformans 
MLRRYSSPTADSSDDVRCIVPQPHHANMYTGHWSQHTDLDTLARAIGYHDLQSLPDEPRYHPHPLGQHQRQPPARPASRADNRPYRYSGYQHPRALSSSHPRTSPYQPHHQQNYLPGSPRHAATCPPRASSPLSPNARAFSSLQAQHQRSNQSRSKSPTSTTRPTSPRFHRPISPTLPDLCPNSPELYRHSIISLPSPSRSRPDSPANASDSLKNILERQPQCQSQSQSQSRSRSQGQGRKGREEGDSEEYVDVWRGLVERRIWNMGYSSRPLHLQAPPRVRTRRSTTLPSSYPRPLQPQPQPINVTQVTQVTQPIPPASSTQNTIASQSNDDQTSRPVPQSPPKKLAFLRNLFPLSSPTITTAVPPTPFPTPLTPPLTSPLSPHETAKEKEKGEEFDVDKVYERLRVAEGRVSFDELGLGLCLEDKEGENEAGEETEGDTKQPERWFSET